MYSFRLHTSAVPRQFCLRRSATGFSFVELLIVLALVVLLVALLFPVFSNVREKGRTSTCQNNLKQLGLAIHQYVGDNDGHYPAISEQIQKLLPYVKDSRIFSCPDGIKDGQWITFNSIKSDYGLNPVWIYTVPNIPMVAPLPTQIPVGNTHESQLAKASDINLAMEANQYWPLKTVISQMGRTSRWPTPHSGGANYLFLDGHVKWCLPETKAEIDDTALPPMPPAQ